MTKRFTATAAVVRGCALLAGACLMVLASACAKHDATKDAAKDATTDSTAAAFSGSAGRGSGSSASTPMTQSQREDLHDAIRGYRLSEGTVDKVIAATQKMHALEKANPKLAAAMNQEHDDASDARSIDDLASHLDAMPPVKAVLSSVGLSARDYVLTSFTLMEAGAAYQFQKAGKLPPSSELAKDVSPGNLAYVGAHQAQLQALQKANDASSDGDE